MENDKPEVESTEEITEADTIQADLEQAQAQAAEYLDSLRRLKAEFENFRKRMLREQSEFIKFASQGLILELLPVVDNFERALEHNAEGGHLEEYRKGLSLVRAQLLEALAKEGLSVIDSVGQPFDPHRHEAVMQEESDEFPEGTVVRELEKGYVLKDRVIRPAKVTVAK